MKQANTNTSLRTCTCTSYFIENNMAPTYLSDCLPTTIGETVTYNLRNNDDYRTRRCRLQTSSKSSILK
jgi:hypothetical protein